MRKPRLIYSLLILGVLVLTAYLAVDYVQYKRVRDEKSIQLGKQAGIRVAKALDSRLFAISERAGRCAVEVSKIGGGRSAFWRVFRMKTCGFRSFLG